MDKIEWFILNYGYLAIFVSLFLGLIGLPVPYEVLMTTIGYYCSVGFLSTPVAILIATLGSFLGMVVSYFVGSKIGRPIIYRVGKWIGLTTKRLLRVEKWMMKFGYYTVTFGYFIPGFRHAICYFCGISKISLKKYMVFAFAGALIWSSFFILIGKFIGVLNV